jgi:carboxyl-terminal processing protease
MSLFVSAKRLSHPRIRLMSKPFARWIVVLTLVLSTLPALARQAQAPALEQQQQQQQLATVEQLSELKVEAYKAFKGGQFDRTSELLSRAASLSADPALEQMSAWISKFQTQRQGLVEERRKQFDKSVAETRLLLEKGKPQYALDRAKDAYLLADDKEAFRKEPWVDALVKQSIALAEQHEKDQQWLEAQFLYGDLGAIEPTNPEWKERLKLTTRRLRLIGMYTPDDFKSTWDAYLKERESVEALVNPTTQPTTKPSDEENDSFKTDWHDTLLGVRLDMLVDALEETRSNYYKEIGYKSLTLGGLNGLRALLTTPGLEKAFPTLADDASRTAFLKSIDEAAKLVEHADANNEHILLRATLLNLQAVNTATLGLPEEVIVCEFSDGAFGDLDQFTGMIWPAALEEFQRTTQGEFSGVGIQIQLDEEGNLKVISPLEDTPAYRLGIEAGDIITRINGKNARNISIDQAVKHITGPQGTTVTLSIKKAIDDSVKDYTIRREQIKVASVKGWRHLPGGGWDFYVDADQKIAYVRLTNFTRTSDRELGEVLKAMRQQGARGMVLDLRDNPGGLLTSATDIADRFLEQGTIVSTRGERGNLPDQPPIVANPAFDDARLPLVVLVNQFSASASEIVSGALQDHKRALIVGERTFGKGSVQMLFPLSRRSAALKLTTSHYYLPSGRCIHREETGTTWGVDPDLTVEMTHKQKKEALEARQELDVLREKARNGELAKPKKDLLACDPQLSAAVLLLKLQLAGGTPM